MSRPPQNPHPRRAILLGASNLTLALPCILETLRGVSPDPVDVFGALGHGRSYGSWSRVLHRALPGILQCGLWREIERHHPVRERPLALVTDIGNDLIYGFSVSRIADWIRAVLQRLIRLRAEVVMTELPASSLQRLPAWRYHLARMTFFAGWGEPWPELLARVAELNGRLRSLAEEFGVQRVEQQREWYGFDPIHIRRSCRRAVWSSVLARWPDNDGRPCGPRLSVPERLRLHRHRPAERRIWGVEQSAEQPLESIDGLRLFLY